MSRYSMEVVSGLDIMEIQLGFDDGVLGYWLTIADDDGPKDELADYSFHNMRDVSGVSMTVTEVEERLASYGVGIPHEIAEALVRDGKLAGYREAIGSGELAPKHVLAEFKDFEHRTMSSTPSDWVPRGTLPDAWFLSHGWHIHQKRGLLWKFRRWLASRPRRH